MASKSGSGSIYSLSKDAEKEGAKFDLHPMSSVGEGDMIEMVDTSNGQFHRSFTPHQVHVRIKCNPLSGMPTR